MHLNEAMKKASQILEEEQTQPTISYNYKGPIEAPGWTVATGNLILANERRGRPRPVHEDPKLYEFKSTNFDLLVKIFSQVAEVDRPEFLSQLLEWVRKARPAQVLRAVYFPIYQGCTSALALLAEFCVRTGHLKELLEATTVLTLPMASLVIMLMEIEEMIALNFNLFSDSELESIPTALNHQRGIAVLQTFAARGEVGKPMKPNPHYVRGFEAAGKEIVAAIDGIREECRKARYFYLKGALQELPNLEIESDKLKVEGFLVKLGFSKDMVRALDAAENDYKATATTFELKNCLGHLRSFLEHLHREAAKSVVAKVGATVPDTWGDATLYLRQQGYFTLQHERFSASLYTLLSDESVHPLTTDREYARLLRNVVIEYGVMFLTVLDKRGVKI